MDVELIPGPERESFGTTVQRTGVPQREKLERTMKNLCAALGIKRIFWKVTASDSTFYRPDGAYAYQSASNTILQLSEGIAELHGSK
ncbi:MAG: hypothetical protein ABW072_10360 [Sedimenticola sp.]